jgi:UDP-N-acetylglucosamine 1-carboxyvinyltransferase
MDKFVITGGNPLHGTVAVGGAKNVALKVLVASLLTHDALVIHNVPLLYDVYAMLDLLGCLGVTHQFDGHTLTIKHTNLKNCTVPLEVAARLRTSSMVVGPMLLKFGEAKIPNPGGCRLGARPIDRHIDALKAMGAAVTYHPEDGYFHIRAKRLHGATITFPKNTHTGTETLILAAVCASGVTILKNAAEEVEIDGLIDLLNRMGAKIIRTNKREITITGVDALHGAEYSVMPDRNEEVTFAIAAAITGGNIIVKNSQRSLLSPFLDTYVKAGARYEVIDERTTRYMCKGDLRSTDVVTMPHPGFMTDWQAPWAVLMTQAKGISTIHETIFESRFQYVGELQKMGAHIEFYDPKVMSPEKFYNFNWKDRIEGNHQGIRIHGPTELHNAVLEINDLRAGATLILAALTAQGESYIHGVQQVDRGYEDIEHRLGALGANVKRIKEDV